MFGKSSNPNEQEELSRSTGAPIQQTVPPSLGQKEQVKTMDKTSTIIAHGTTFKGNLKSDDSVQIDGTFEGEIDVKQTVHLGSTASIKANIKAGEVKISGRVDGNIEAKDRLEILSSGKLFGDIKTPRLIIAEGVVFEGHCTMGTDKKMEASSASATAKPAGAPAGVTAVR